MDLRFSRFLKLDQIVAFLGRERSYTCESYRICIDSVDSADTLNQSSGIPRNIVVKDDV